MKYICVAPSYQQFDINGNSLGQSGLRALYYNKKLHRQRIYRSSFPIPSFANFRIFAYKSKNKAQELCDLINDKQNENFRVVEYIMPINNIQIQLDKQK